ncbi:caspase family protein [Streptomyces sparsogenes]|uniref:Caspase domain-containing protein n=1 Tax=Streptomyces sparsogenes DSM 40356 TaxID=1331668 RepID=A0A1R1SIU1_9ACTN|nr:caspase family protein [Streptomyces sparsogenes]OMI38220.1 hypothetical protein SPAR_17135 [Streptomyces sparsogenes DSM 40356]
MTQVTHDWSRTHAVIVAVEQYNGGDGLNLDGPVHDAIGMWKWLTGQGVPAENIQLLASPLGHNKAALEAVHPAYRPADRADVRKVFREGLREIDGDWLWVYWAGHGVQARGGRWSLLYPETHDTDLQGLDAENLVHLLRTDCLPYSSGVDRVTVVIDACREALPAGTHELADTPDTLTTEPQTIDDRQIFWMRACQAGGVTKNQQRVGLFTSVLLRQLHAASGGGATPDLDRVWQGVDDEFLRLSEDEGSRQLPTVSVSNWRQREREYTWAPRPSDPTRRRARRQLLLEVGRLCDPFPGSRAGVAARLCGAFGEEPPSSAELSTDAMVDWALRHRHGAATLLAALGEALPDEPILSLAREACFVLQPGQWLTCPEYDELVGLLGELSPAAMDDFAGAARAEIPGVFLPAASVPAPLADALEELTCGPHQLPQLLRAVERFAAAADGPPVVDLRDWSLRCAIRLGLEGALHDRRAEAEDRAARARAAGPVDERLQIRLGPSGPGQRRAYEVWSRRGDEVVSLAKVDTPSTVEEIQRGLDDLLLRHARVQETLVEFFVEPTDLELDVHCWQLGASGPFERSLGTDFPVVVRCGELREVQRHLWMRRWERVDGASAGDLYRLPGHLDKSRLVYGALQARDDIPGVVMTTPARARAEVFTACLYGGVPVMVWHKARELAEAEAELEPLLGGAEQLKSLPQYLRRLRSASEADESHPGRHVALLWDDPHRPLPERLHLSAP